MAATVALAARALTPATTALALLWVAALRLWDDVHSRDADAARHPERVVVIGPRAPFARRPPARDFGRARGHRLRPPRVRARHRWRRRSLAWLPPRAAGIALLLKYPAMAAVLADGDVAIARLAIVFVCFVIDERLTGELPLPRRALPFIVAAVLLLVGAFELARFLE